MLREAERARDEAIKVDEFSPHELEATAFHQPDSRPKAAPGD
jgi:hypothetical protein